MNQSSKLRTVYMGVLSIAILVILWFQMEVSSGYETVFQCFKMEPKYIALNLVTLGVMVIVLCIIFNRIWLSNLILSICSFLVALVNYYMISLKGMPFTVLEMKNFRTGLNVIDAYKLKIDKYVIFLFVLLLISVFLCLIEKRIELKTIKNFKKQLIEKSLLIVLSVAILFVGYFSPKPIKPKEVISWTWADAYHHYGYVACSLEMLCKTWNVVSMPSGYSDDIIKKLEIKKEEKDRTKTPDIIMILNETFYDLKQITDIKTNKPYLDNIEALKNTVRGYAVVPGGKGGTNASEYELLTSNSLQLMQGATPFNVLNMKSANSIVSHLKQLGYKTLAGHSEPAINYSRGRAYPDMGFDEVRFDADFESKQYYKKRWFETDESLYKNMIFWYENMPEDSPRFMYLLTIQNHAGYDMNSPEEDIIFAENDYGKYTQEINEFLSCIKLSDIAFKDLTEYFETVDRPVIICMVGDHAPVFADEIVDEKYTGEEVSRRIRSVPFVIWSNYATESHDIGSVSMNYLIPTMLDRANVEISPYYQYMLNLKNEIPILTSYDVYYDNLNNEYFYDDTNQYSEMINNYLNLEYNNLGKDRIQPLFDAYLKDK